MALGLPSPRPSLRLLKDEAGQISLRTGKSREDNDLTQPMRRFARERSRQLTDLCGFIVCAKSPSCGMERVRVYDRAGARKNGVGIFTGILMEELPWLPVEEDGRLNDPLLRENFVARVYTPVRIQSNAAGTADNAAF